MAGKLKRHVRMSHRTYWCASLMPRFDYERRIAFAAIAWNDVLVHNGAGETRVDDAPACFGLAP